MKVMKSLICATVFVSGLFAAECPKVVVIAPVFNEKTLGLEYRGKDVKYAEEAVAKAVADRYSGKVMTEAEYEVISATSKPQQLIRVRVASYALKPEFKTVRYAQMNIEETFYSSPDLTKLTKTINQDVTGPKWFGVNLPLKWAVRFFVRETAKEALADKGQTPAK